MSKEVISSTKKSILWGVIGRFGSQALILLSTFILARLISPSEFGMIAMITVFSNFAIIMIDLGFGSALIYKESADKKSIDTVFSVNMISAFILTLIFYFGAGWIANFYDQPELKNLVQVISPIFLVIALSGVNKVLAKKRLDFKTVNIIEILALLLGIFVAIILAIFDYGAWSIIFQMLSTQLTITILYFILLPVHQSFRFHKKEFKELANYGKSIIGQTTISYVTRSSDQLLAGKIVGDEALGLYTKGYAIVMLPVTTISSLINQIMFPSITLIQSNLKEVQRVYIRCVSVTIFFTFPLLVVVSSASKSLVLTLFGNDWIGMVPLIKYLCVMAALRSLASVNSATYNAMGKPNLNFKLSLFFSLIILLSIFIGLKLNGLVGMLQAFCLSLMLTTTIDYFFITQITQLQWYRILKPVVKIVLICLLMYAVIKLLDSIYSSEISYIDLIIKMFVGGLFYFIMSIIFQQDNIKSLRGLLNRKNL